MKMSKNEIMHEAAIEKVLRLKSEGKLTRREYLKYMGMKEPSEIHKEIVKLYSKDNE
jgi:hypothetical protein